MTRSRNKARFVLAFVGGLASALSLGCGKGETPPHVVLVTLDTVRADFLGCYGSDWIQTPNLDAFAAQGALFEDVTCLIPATLTSHTSIMTSLYPRKSGVRFGSFVVPEEVTTLAEVFKSSGYRTAAFVSAAVLDSKYRLDQGFDVYDDGPLRPFERPASEINAKVFEWLAKTEDSKEPAFLWVHYYDAHTPYHPPAPWDKKYDPDYQGRLSGASSDITQLIVARGVGASTGDLHHLRALYGGEISALDEKVGELLKKLEESLAPEKTLVAITSDHGEMIGEHHKFFHGEDLYDPALRVPLLIRYPGTLPPGTVEKEFASLLDLAPTLLGLAGLPEIEAAQGEDLSADIVTPATPAEERRLVAFLETEETFLIEGDKTLGTRTERWKFIDNRSKKRPPSLYGRVVNELLDRPMFAEVFIKDSTFVGVSAHIRYHSRETLAYRNTAPNLKEIPTTFITSVPFGSDPIHLEAVERGALAKPNPGWRPVVTPNLYERAKEFGETNGYPTDWMVVESVAVDLSVPWDRETNEAILDNLQLVALQHPQRREWRRLKPIADMETGQAADTLIASATGPKRESHPTWVRESAFPGPLNISQKISVRFLPLPGAGIIDELYDLGRDPEESKNLLRQHSLESLEHETVVQVYEGLSERIREWVEGTQGLSAESASLSAEEREQMKAVGYFR